MLTQERSPEEIDEDDEGRKKNTEKAPLRVGIYARISVDDDKVPKCKNQIAMCRDMHERDGEEVVDVYIDDGVSAVMSKNGVMPFRKNYQRLLADIAAGRLQVVSAVDEDRIAREPVHEKGPFLTLCAMSGVKIKTVHGGLVDPAEPEGEMMSMLRALVAKVEVKKKSRRQVDGNAARRAAGLPYKQGVRPFGYEKDRVHLQEDEAALIRDATKRLIAGEVTRHAIMVEWNKAGVRTTVGKPFTQEGVKGVIARWRNARVVEFDEQPANDVEGQWEGIVTRNELDQVMAIYAARSGLGRPWSESTWLCSGIARCGTCGMLLRAGNTPERKGTRNPNLRCSTHPGTKVEGVRHAAIQIKVIDPVVRDAVISSYVFAPESTDPESGEVTLGSLHSQLSSVRDRLAELSTAVKIGALKASEIAKDAAELREDEGRIEAQIQEMVTRSVHLRMTSEAKRKLWSGVDGGRISIDDAAALKVQIGEQFDALPVVEQRQLVRSALKVTVHPGYGPSRIVIDHLLVPGLNETPAVVPMSRAVPRP